MRSKKSLVIFPVATLHFAVMPWCIRTNYLVLDPMLPQTHLEKGGLIPVGGESVCNLVPLSVWMHSIVQGKAFTRCSTKRAEE